MSTTGNGMHKRSRNRLTRKNNERGKINLKAALQVFKPDEKVVVVPDPSVQQNIPHRRFFGITGTVIERRGRAYTVRFLIGNTSKYVNLMPIHLRKI